MKTMRDLSVKSPLDVDFYKFTMAYFVWKYFPDVIVKYKFKNRTKGVNLSHLEIGVRQELNDIKRLYKYTESELEFIHSLQMFPEEFIRFLALVELPAINIYKSDDNELSIETEGSWKHSIWWETMVLSTVNHLCYKDLGTLTGKDFEAIGNENIAKKIEVLKQNPHVRFSEFGTRRRHSYEWQKHIVEILKKEVPEQLTGTSNVLLAKELGLKPIGTMAHELFMVGSRLFGDTDEDIRGSHGKILDMWYELYGEKLSIALTDTFGSKFFFEDFGQERARKWLGMRQDSGHPDEFAKTQIEYYKNLEIDSHKKLFVPSDGLNTEVVVDLTNAFQQNIGVVAGWGTDLTNDVGFKPLSIVMKAVEANGQGLVKLSDNLNKATGSKEDIERFKRIFGYENISSQEIVY
jgi:nicotinate phosphoribosyltransferase